MSTSKSILSGRRSLRKLALSALIVFLTTRVVHAQDLAPRAYLITPVRTNAITLVWSYFDGGLDFNGTAPVTNATGIYHVPIFSYYRSFSLLGRAANFAGSLPYGVGTFQGSIAGQEQQAYRSGLLDAGFRLSVNLKGGPAMSLQQFAKWKQKSLLGVSLKVIAPTGQYDPTKFVNWGINRWAFKPELGYSQRWGNWILDGYGGAWFYTTNNASFAAPVPKPQSQAPIASLEGHLSYDFSRGGRLWASLDGNFWFGGTTTLGGVTNLQTKQTSSRIGGTFSFPLSKRQSIKVSYSNGAYVRFGGDYKNLSVGWQYGWFGKPW